MLTVLHGLIIKTNRLVYASILEDIGMNSHGSFYLYPAPTPSMLTSIYCVANKLHLLACDRYKYIEWQGKDRRKKKRKLTQNR